MEYALQLLICLLLGFYIGQWLDAKTGAQPWFSLTGLLLGMVLGIGIMYKRALYRQKADAQGRKKEKEIEEKKEP